MAAVARKKDYVFTYEPEGGNLFQCDLECRPCGAFKKNGIQCTKLCCFGIDKCSVHLKSLHSLAIRRSNIVGAGMGLFAVSPSRNVQNPVIERGKKIIEYTGETITNAELERRYGGDEYTAPYAVERRSDGRFIDSACVRSVAAFANTSNDVNECNTLFREQVNGLIFLQATRPINHNEEIIVDYQSRKLIDIQDIHDPEDPSDEGEAPEENQLPYNLEGGEHALHRTRIFKPIRQFYQY